MQKVINVLAVSSFAVSAAIIGAAGYVFVNQDAIVDGIKDQAASMIGDAIGGAVGDLPSLMGGPASQAPSGVPAIGNPGSMLPF